MIPDSRRPSTEARLSDAPPDEVRRLRVVRDHGHSPLEHISVQVGAVLDPLAVRCRGWPVEQIRPLVAQAWHREFGAGLGQVALSDTAAALRDGRPWCEALWTAGW